MKSPVNTGEQPQPETAPSLTETNGQSQPLPEVVPLESYPAEDRAQPPPEQVAPPTANLKVPKRRRGVTRYTVAKQQLDDTLKETVGLRSVITLLESEIDQKNKGITKLRKNDMSQQSEIKKLSILIDYQKHQLRKESVPCRDVPASNNWSPSPNDCENGSSVAVNRHRRKPTKAVSARKPPVSHCNSIIDCDAPRSQPASLLEPSPSAPPCPQVAVIGSSIVRGVGLGLNKRGVDAVTYTYPGYEVPQITERISCILTKAYQPVLQCGEMTFKIIVPLPKSWHKSIF